MSATKEPLPVEPHKHAADNGVVAELSEEAIRNLTGFFDVLIQMDFAQKQKQRNERNDENGNDLQSTASITTKAD